MARGDYRWVSASPPQRQCGTAATSQLVLGVHRWPRGWPLCHSIRLSETADNHPQNAVDNHPRPGPSWAPGLCTTRPSWLRPRGCTHHTRAQDDPGQEWWWWCIAAVSEGSDFARNCGHSLPWAGFGGRRSSSTPGGSTGSDESAGVLFFLLSIHFLGRTPACDSSYR